MEFIKGVKINDIQGIKKLGLKQDDCSELLVNTFATMIFNSGHIHGDPHPGNVLIRNS